MVYLLKMLKKFRMSQLTPFLIFLAIIFVFSSCSKAPEKAASFSLTQEERAWMEDFFKGLMIQEEGIYTLWGTKPVTEIIINYYTDADKQLYWPRCPRNN